MHLLTHNITVYNYVSFWHRETIELSHISFIYLLYISYNRNVEEWTLRKKMKRYI